MLGDIEGGGVGRGGGRRDGDATLRAMCARLSRTTTRDLAARYVL